MDVIRIEEYMMVVKWSLGICSKVIMTISRK